MPAAQMPYNPETYWDEVAENISVRSEPNFIAGDDDPYYRYKRKRFLALLGSIQFSGKTVLEIGCGPGGNLDFLYSRGCRQLTGVDVSQKMVSLAKKALQDKPVDVRKTDGINLPFADKKFDLVFTSTVLQHITDEKALHELIKEICRVAKDEVFLFEHIESKTEGNESNLGRPVGYYEALLHAHRFVLAGKHSLPIQASYLACGLVRKIFNRKNRKEGEPLSPLSVFLEKLALPITSLFDQIVPSNRDVMLLKFKPAMIA